MLLLRSPLHLGAGYFSMRGATFETMAVGKQGMNLARQRNTMATYQSPDRSNRTFFLPLIVLGVAVSFFMLLRGSSSSKAPSGRRHPPTAEASAKSRFQVDADASHEPADRSRTRTQGNLGSGDPGLGTADLGTADLGTADLGFGDARDVNRHMADPTSTSGPRSITGHVAHPMSEDMALTIPRPFADIADRSRPSGDVHVRDHDWRKQFPSNVVKPSPNVVRTSLTEVRPYMEWDVHQTASDSLGRIGSASVPALIKALSNPDPKRRAEAAWLLGRIGPDARSAVHALVAALKDTHPEVKKSAARALGQIGPDAAEAVDALMEVVNETAPLGVTGDPDLIGRGL